MLGLVIFKVASIVEECERARASLYVSGDSYLVSRWWFDFCRKRFTTLLPKRRALTEFELFWPAFAIKAASISRYLASASAAASV